MEAVAALTPGTGRALVKALRTEGLIEPVARNAWRITSGGANVLVSDGGQDMHQELAGGVRLVGVEALGGDDEPNAQRGQLIDGGH